ncbi:MAG: TIR domain-containing protein [Parvibaculaceae bacterium]|nr:TIR domain-containing protein [Parvibaculaceae bacterium]
MKITNPIAFFSYVRAVDEHEYGRLSELRKRLQGEVELQTGGSFPIFQDRNDIKWGQLWKERIKESVDSASFLIPIVTPSYFNSPACRDEFEAFEEREKTLGSKDLILPIYYVSCDVVEKITESADDPIAKVIRERNWADWRRYRFSDLKDPAVGSAIADLAVSIKARLDSLASIQAAAVDALSRKEDAPSVVRSKRRATLVKMKTHPRLTVRSTDVPELLPKGKVKVSSSVDRSEYYAFTKRYDEIIRAEELASPSEIAKLHAYLTMDIDPLSEENRNTLSRLRKRIELRVGRNDLCVCILIDNSGSMRGSKIRYTAAWTSLVVQNLEQCGVSTEVLGFTTRTWKGGQSRELWVSKGKPKQPGRLNDLRHIVYKEAGESLRKSEPSFALMLREGLLKENIDGEALLWAVERIQKIDAKKRMILVLSDGAPVDDSTLSESDGGFLSDHLSQAVNWIGVSKVVDSIVGLGIEYSDERFYPTMLSGSLDNIGILALEAVADFVESGA